MAHDPDDWFDEPDVSDVPDRRVVAHDDWLEPGEEAAGRGPRLDARTARIALVVLVLLVLLIAGLAAAGVFSSGKAPTTTISVPSAAPTTATTPATTAPTVTVPTATLKPGDTGPEVKQLQQALASLGYYKGAIDGQYGPATKDAVTAFQTASHLTADGVAGPKTLSALSAAVGP